MILPPGELAPDLQARLRWIERQLRGDLEQKLQAARYSRQLELSRKEAELVRTYQEALMNADLMSATGGTRANRPTPERERILARIETQMTEQVEASQRLLNEYEAKMRQDTELTFAATQQQIWEKMQERLHSTVNSGSKTADRLSKELSSWKTSDYSGPATVWHLDPSGVLGGDLQPDRVEVTVAFTAARGRLAAALAIQKARLSGQIYDETVLAMHKSALQTGFRLTIPPMQPSDGPDVTELLRPQLRTMWQQ
jgi:hypothetical protein